MSGDMEIVALKAGGVTLYRLLPPALMLGLIGCLLTAFMAMVALPFSRLAYKKLQFEVASNHLELGLIHLLKPRQFIDHFNGVVMYVHDIDPSSHTLKDIFIEKRLSEDLVSTIIAPRGILFVQPEQLGVNLRLYDGGIYQVDARQGASHTQQFRIHDIRLAAKQNIKSYKSKPKDEEEMSLKELRHYLNTAKKRDDQFYIALMEWHKKFSLPVACLALSLLALPLGIQARTSKRSYGIGLGMLFFFIYYILLAMGWVFGEAGIYPPLIGMWLPNLVMAGLGIVFLKRAANEKPFGVGQWFKSVLKPSNK
jgi:lipopolysaccharide export system permease protein